MLNLKRSYYDVGKKLPDGFFEEIRQNPVVTIGNFMQ